MVSNQHPVHWPGTAQSQPSPKHAGPVPVSLDRTKRLRPHFLPPNRAQPPAEPQAHASAWRRRLLVAPLSILSQHRYTTLLIAEASCSVNVAVVAVTLCATDNRLHRLTTPCPLRFARTSIFRFSLRRDCYHVPYACPRPFTIDYARYTHFTSTLTTL